MKKRLLVLLLVVQCAFAQDAQREIALGKREMVVESVYLGDKGFILKTGIPGNIVRGTNRLFYFTGQGALVWEKKIDNEYQGLRSDNVTVAAPDGSMVYHIESKTNSFAGEKQQLTQINAKGEAKKLELAIGDDYGQSLQSIFCDEKYLYYLATQNGHELKDKKKGTEKLILNRFTHNGLKHSKVVLDLPAIANPELTSFWSFAGQGKLGKYLVSKTLLTHANQQTFDLVVIDADGKVVKKTTIAYELGDGYIRPAVSENAGEGKEWHHGSRNLANLNFQSTGGTMTTTVHTPGAAPGPPTTRHFASLPGWPTSAGFGYLYLDAIPEENAIYAYGLLGPGPFKKVAPGYEGFYVYKFDLNGKAVWKLHNPGTKELLDSKFYTTHGHPADRRINLVSGPDGGLTFSISFTPNLKAQPDLFLFDISGQGQVTRERTTNKGAEEPAMVVALHPKAYAYVKKQPSRKSDVVVPVSFATPGGEVLLLQNLSDQKLNVLYFKQ
jgi:hypothetical protein